jgi:hypothetical protein
MANDIQIFNYNGNGVTFRKGDSVMVNATEMAKSFGKRPNDFLSAKSTQELISSLSAKTGISATALVVVNQGGNNQGTWLHEDLALIFAQWLSPTFYLWCNDRIKELLTKGFVAVKPLTKSQQTLAAVRQLCEIAQQQVELEQRQIEMESEQKLLVQKVSHIEEVVKPNGFMSVMGFANIHHLNIGTKAAATIGRLASKWCKKNFKHTEKTKHERWGEVNTYPMEALRVCFAEFYPDKAF